MNAIRDCAAAVSASIIERLRRVNPDVTREQVEHALLGVLAPEPIECVEANPDIALAEQVTAAWAKRQRDEIEDVVAVVSPVLP